MARAKDIVDRAEQSGMLVDQARLALHDAGDQFLQARVSIHAFRPEPFGDLAAKGLATTAKAEQDGHAALDELQFRRRGLAVATIFIIGEWAFGGPEYEVPNRSGTQRLAQAPLPGSTR